MEPFNPNGVLHFFQTSISPWFFTVILGELEGTPPSLKQHTGDLLH